MYNQNFIPYFCTPNEQNENEYNKKHFDKNFNLGTKVPKRGNNILRRGLL